MLASLSASSWPSKSSLAPSSRACSRCKGISDVHALHPFQIFLSFPVQDRPLLLQPFLLAGPAPHHPVESARAVCLTEGLSVLCIASQCCQALSCTGITVHDTITALTFITPRQLHCWTWSSCLFITILPRTPTPLYCLAFAAWIYLDICLFCATPCRFGEMSDMCS